LVTKSDLFTGGIEKRFVGKLFTEQKHIEDIRRLENNLGIELLPENIKAD
jgi:hypothetical protein